ncbi:RNA polymerase Rpb4-domain-containing protein [Cunninghamella echinulata]|nr:RNA polymerase Rpb4-domain-containing protein [Cunninghamella echinulata]
MIIKSARAALISNYEVLNLLKERHEYQREKQIDNPELEYPEHLRTIQFELTGYLEKTPVNSQTTEQINTFLKNISQYSLTLGEKLQILNLRPKSDVEIYLLIEECEERFNEEDLENMLHLIKTDLPHEEDEIEDADMDEEEEEEEDNEDEE